ncbi:SusE domain-containing protein [Marinigracilibium pacificum]|uniref:SusF/SusE family outer membrane protein n=1 Tax=Marinigracilibium pacificum TaxID=2729599 RepID=A0A848J4Z7_9BACT|nr:SusF/SusE family outer membrane protein [Marinigracilibium pacificum]NMM49534.1 SusF/SusE family outer membrane protein [Marinigracilibium pacificum]
MKKLLKYIPVLIISIVFSGCNDDPELTVLQPVSFSSEITATPNSILISEPDTSNILLTVDWPAVDYHRDVPVTYSIQITTPGDTALWNNAWEKIVGDDILTAGLTGKELNTIAIEKFGIAPEESGILAIRVKSYVDRAAFSQPVTFEVTPYEVITSYPSLYIAGDFQGWNISNAATIVSVEDNGIYEGYLYLPEGGTNEFKVYAQPDWAPVSYGDGGNGTVIEANYAGGNFIAPSSGYYLFSVDLNTMTYLLIKTEWGIIGAATPSGWDADTDLTYDENSQSWKVTADMIANGSFKFRANDGWQIDFGIDEEGNLAYANHPWLDYVEQPHLTVPEDGNYTITLDLHIPGKYTYSIVKN